MCYNSARDKNRTTRYSGKLSKLSRFLLRRRRNIVLLPLDWSTSDRKGAMTSRHSRAFRIGEAQGEFCKERSAILNCTRALQFQPFVSITPLKVYKATFRGPTAQDRSIQSQDFWTCNSKVTRIIRAEVALLVGYSSQRSGPPDFSCEFSPPPPNLQSDDVIKFQKTCRGMTRTSFPSTKIFWLCTVSYCDNLTLGLVSTCSNVSLN